MPAPLLETKLYVPRPRAGMVPRPRLRARLDAGAAAKLMLVSAPAGFGKTTLLADWLAAGPAAPDDERLVAWLSLDRADNDAVTFWNYVIAAVRTALPGIGATELALLASTQPPPIELVLTTLLNDLGSSGSDLVLVLDDYHLIDARDIQETMGFLLDHLPPQLHLVIVSRADPPVPLARLRARGELVEVRAAELRFTPEEVTAYLNGAMGLQLAAQDVTALEHRTEGWIAALQLAALSMQGRDDVAGFIAGFTGDDRYIVDYLVEEVLLRQGGEVRDFLLQTSLLGRLNGPLCDAVTGTGGGKAMLESLDRDNLFLVPLDDRRQWYRYHHLFADVLRTRLSEESPDLVALLHRRASDWYAEHGELSDAVEHAIAGGHHERAADLIEPMLPALSRDRQEATMRAWIERLPAETVAARPVLSNGYAGALLSTGEVDGVDRHLRAAERWLDDPEGLIVVHDEGFRRLPAGVAVHRAGLALVTGDPSATVAHARRALSLIDEGDHLGHAAANALMGLASWSRGDLSTAREAYTDSLGSMQRAGHLSDVLGLSIALADIQITQGCLGDAMHTYERALQLNPGQLNPGQLNPGQLNPGQLNPGQLNPGQLNPGQLNPAKGEPVLRGTAEMYVGMSVLLRERNDLAQARQVLARAVELGAAHGLPQYPYRSRVAAAGIRMLEGDLDAAVDLLDQAEQVYVGDFSPNVRPVPSMRARVWIRQGRLDEAFAWARDQGLSAEDEPTYLREHEHVTLARALVARRSVDEATALLDRLLATADDGGRTGTVIEVLMLQSLAHALRDDVPAALVPLERALTLAEPERYVRVFLDEGAPMMSLVESAGTQGIATAYVERLAGTPEKRPPSAQRLLDPLSERELEVLRLLATDLGGPEIARHLVVSLNTVRTHTKNIYTKLGVNNRRAAVRRGEELDLMSRTGDNAR